MFVIYSNDLPELGRRVAVLILITRSE